jgi:hypothetical protein
MARPDELKEVLLNLVENARAALDGQGRIEVRATGCMATMGVEIEVRTTATASRRSCWPRIFEPHFSTRSTGTGLGLAIVRRLVESWGGTVTADSEAGQGTTVRIRLLPASRRRRRGRRPGRRLVRPVVDDRLGVAVFLASSTMSETTSPLRTEPAARSRSPDGADLAAVELLDHVARSQPGAAGRARAGPRETHGDVVAAQAEPRDELLRQRRDVEAERVPLPVRALAPLPRRRCANSPSSTVVSRLAVADEIRRGSGRPGWKRATRACRSATVWIGWSSMATMTSPSCRPARSAGVPGVTA